MLIFIFPVVLGGIIVVRTLRARKLSKWYWIGALVPWIAAATGVLLVQFTNLSSFPDWFIRIIL